MRRVYSECGQRHKAPPSHETVRTWDLSISCIGGLGKASHAVSWVGGLRERDSKGLARKSQGNEK